MARVAVCVSLVQEEGKSLQAVVKAGAFWSTQSHENSWRLQVRVFGFRFAYASRDDKSSFTRVLA